VEPDWTKRCSVCGQPPVVPLTGMCGPCTFGEADTAGGEW
jgi:NMD protein affecting ribosome stability and mRNA decay